MNLNPDEKQFQALFGELKQRDRQLAPPFEREVAAAMRMQSQTVVGQIRYRGLVATAAALVIVAAVIIMLMHRPAGKPSIVRQSNQPDRSKVDLGSESPALSLSTWQSPTAFLLNAPDDWGQPAEVNDEPSTGHTPSQPHLHGPT
jgi:hypothetical protein